MAEMRKKLAEIDPVWSRIRDESEQAVSEEPLLGGLIHSWCCTTSRLNVRWPIAAP